MALLVLIIAIVNLYLGYAVTVRLGRYARPLTVIPAEAANTAGQWVGDAPEVQATPDPEKVDRGKVEAEEGAAEDDEAEDAQPAQSAPGANEGIPEDWSEMLGDTMLTDSFVEAAVHVLRLEVGDYRNALVGLENRARHLLIHPDGDQLTRLLNELRDLNIAWRAKQDDAAAHLNANKGNLGGLEYLGDNIEVVLLTQATEVMAACDKIDLLDLRTDFETSGRELIKELCKLLDLAHDLRDMMLEMFMAIARSADKLNEIDQRGTVDSLTGLLNRTGIEAVMQNWISKDPNRERAASAAILDIDHLSRINETIGTESTDHILAELGHMFDGLTRQSRGFDVTGRFAGQRFFVFFGDTGPRGAVNAVERMRQKLEASKVIVDGEEFTLSASAGVTEFGASDTSDTLVKRSLGALRAAKKAGRNKSFLDEGDGPVLVTPPNFAMPGHTIELGE
jgi:diguanylate cyclase (GGDEF)-like protein